MKGNVYLLVQSSWRCSLPPSACRASRQSLQSTPSLDTLALGMVPIDPQTGHSRIRFQTMTLSGARNLKQQMRHCLLWWTGRAVPERVPAGSRLWWWRPQQEAKRGGCPRGCRNPWRSWSTSAHKWDRRRSTRPHTCAVCWASSSCPSRRGCPSWTCRCTPRHRGSTATITNLHSVSIALKTYRRILRTGSRRASYNVCEAGGNRYSYAYNSAEPVSPALPPVAVVDVTVRVSDGAIAVMHASQHSPSILLHA